MTLNLHLPGQSDMLRPTITVIGVGGAGGNAVNNMIASQLEGVNFVVANTDAQALEHTLAPVAIQLGGALTKGLGAGANPEVGRAAAEEVSEDICKHIEGSNMVFITAGMGGGTGTGAASVVARVARERGILTVAVVTKPFQFEGAHRMRLAEAGLKELQQYVDTLIIIPNQNLFRIANERTTFADAFKMADEVLHSGVRGVTDLMVKPGLINLDFADIRTVMREMGKAMMGTGEGTGDRRAMDAAEAAISNPLLDDVSLKGAKAVLINITGGMDMTLFEVDEATNRIRQEVDPDANIIFGSAFNDQMDGRMRVSVVATGIDLQNNNARPTTAASTAPDTKKPYVFALNPQRPEPPRLQPRTVQDVIKEAPKPAASAPALTPTLAPIPKFESKREPVLAEAETTEDLHVVGVSMTATATSAQAESDTEVMDRPKSEPALSSKVTELPVEPVQEKHREIPSTRGLFQRIADVSKVLAAKPEAHEKLENPMAKPTTQDRMQVKEKARPQPSKTPSLFAEDDQYLDIPAFLRRQNN
jgi:cell division protein FtsZ